MNIPELISCLGVNGSEPEFKRMMSEYKLESKLVGSENNATNLPVEPKNRHRVWDELRYSLRSVDKYAPPTWRNRIQVLVHDVKYIQLDIRSHRG